MVTNVSLDIEGENAGVRCDIRSNHELVQEDDGSQLASCDVVASHSVHMWRYASKSNEATKSADHQQGWSADAVLETPCVLVTEDEWPIVMYAILYKDTP